jgi:hypothetical protein
MRQSRLSRRELHPDQRNALKDAPITAAQGHWRSFKGIVDDGEMELAQLACWSDGRWFARLTGILEAAETAATRRDAWRRALEVNILVLGIPQSIGLMQKRGGRVL